MPGKADFIYMKVYQDILSKIQCGEFKPGERLLPETELKEVYGVSRDTMRKALARLEADNYITRKAATGTFVKTCKTDYQLSHHEGFSEQMRKTGRVPSSEVLSIELLSQYSSKLEGLLELEAGERIYKITRIRKADGNPMTYEISCIPMKLCPNLHTMIYDSTSLYELYENYYGLKMGHITLSIEAELARPEVQKALNLKPNTPMLKINSTMYLEDGRPLYFVESNHIGGKYLFTSTIPRRAPGTT